MPFVVAQANALTLGAALVISLPVFFLTVRALSDLSGVCWGLAFGFLPLTFGLAFAPFNPYQGMGGHIEPGSKSNDPVSTRERRLLVAFYDPLNRRRAVVMLAALFLVMLSLLALARLFVKPKPVPLPAPHAAVGVFLLSMVGAPWAGLLGLTASMRKRWPSIIEEGVAWPESLKFPGPVAARFTSFFSGRFPPFLQPTPASAPPGAAS
jgi:hypothetical protein